MKKIILSLILILGFLCGNTAAQSRHEGHRRHAAYERFHYHHGSPYFIADDRVFYEGHEINGASASSFEILNDGYARDTWNVYYCGGIIKSATSDSFKVLGYGYAKDIWNVYYNGVKINGATPDNFSVL